MKNNQNLKKEQKLQAKKNGIKKVIQEKNSLFLFILLFVLISVALDAYSMVIIKRIADFAMAKAVDKVLSLASLTAILVGLGLIFKLISNFFLAKYYQKTACHVKGYYIKEVLKKDLSEFGKDNLAGYISNMTNDFKTIEKNYLATRTNVISSFALLIANISVAAYFEPIALLIVTGFGVIVLFLSQALGGLVKKSQGERVQIFAKYTNYVREILGGFRTIKSNNLEQKMAKNFSQKSEEVQAKSFTIDKINSFISAGTSALTMILVAGFAFVAVYFASKGNFSVGSIVLLISVLSSVIRQISIVFEELPLMKSVDAVFEIMDEKLSSCSYPEEVEKAKELEQSLALSNIAFAYEEDNDIFTDLSFNFAKNKKYLVIGQSGSGKSTLLRLIRKYIRPQAGTISLDEQDLSKVMTSSYYQRLAYMEQNVFLFEDSIRNNICLYRDYSDQEIEEAIQNAGLSSFIASLPQGLDHIIVDDGKNISGGEKARLAIARALIAKASIILLDEPFANLDKGHGLAIEKSILGLKDITLINISHVIHAETVEAYDQIISLKSGEANLVQARDIL